MTQKDQRIVFIALTLFNLIGLMLEDVCRVNVQRRLESRIDALEISISAEKNAPVKGTRLSDLIMPSCSKGNPSH